MIKRSKTILDYSQPDFYHFSEDSIALAKYVVGSLSLFHKKINALDLCAGCGVIGIEIMNTCPNVAFDFCELQSEFESHLVKNIKDANVAGNVIIGDYHELEGSYDLIVCNPPYFEMSKGRIPASDNRMKCRFFNRGNLTSLVTKMRQLLRVDGKGYFLSREDLVGFKCVAKVAGAYLFELD